MLLDIVKKRLTPISFVILIYLGVKGDIFHKYIYNTLFWLCLLNIIAEYFIYHTEILIIKTEQLNDNNIINSKIINIQKWFKNKTNTKDNFIKRIIDTWSFDIDTATEISKYAEFVKRDFIISWYSWGKTSILLSI